LPKLLQSQTEEEEAKRKGGKKNVLINKIECVRKLKGFFRPHLGGPAVVVVVVIPAAFIFDAHSQASLIGLILYANDLCQKVSWPKSRGQKLD